MSIATITVMNNLIKDTSIPKTYRKMFELYLKWEDKRNEKNGNKTQKSS